MYYAICAGVFGALASLASKWTMNGDVVLLHYLQSIININVRLDQIHYVARGVSLAVTVLCNVLMWYTFSVALSKTDSAAQTTAINTVTNLLITSLLGFLFFDEVFTWTWLAGASLLITGTVVLQQQDKGPEKPKGQ